MDVQTTTLIYLCIYLGKSLTEPLQTVKTVIALQNRRNNFVCVIACQRAVRNDFIIVLVVGMVVAFTANGKTFARTFF